MKKVFRRIVPVLLVIILLFAGYITGKQLINKTIENQKIQYLPSLKFKFLKRPLPILDERPVVINLFNPSCEHCQYMAGQFVVNKEKLNCAMIVMITSAPENVIRKFEKDYGLDTLSFICTARDTANLFDKTFSSTIVPSFFIYDKMHKLNKVIKGETKIENISNALQ